MKTIDRVEAFKNELKNEKQLKTFNIWAFIFSSFYFWYITMYWYFALFLILPFIIAIPFSYLSNSDVGYLVGFLISHIIAGFIANPCYKKYREKYIQLYENVNTDAEVEYFAITLPRLIISTILTGGIYSIYWGYKNWKNYQIATKDNICPGIRAWFFNLTVIDLFSKIRNTTKSTKSYTFYGLCCLLIFIAQTIINKAAAENLITGSLAFPCLLLLILLGILYPFCLVPIQKEINKYTIETLKKPLESKFYPWEIVIIILSVILITSQFLDGYNSNKNTFTDEELSKAAASIGYIYRHTEGYSDVCKQEGYTMIQYPNEFNNFFSHEISALKSFLATKGYTIEKAKQEWILTKVKTNAKKAIYNELDEFRKITTKSLIAENLKIPVENVDWKDEYDSVLTLRDACEIYDKAGLDLLKESENRFFLKANML